MNENVNDKALAALKEIEIQIGKIKGLLSKRAAGGHSVTPAELKMVLDLTALAKSVRKEIEKTEHK